MCAAAAELNHRQERRASRIVRGRTASILRGVRAPQVTLALWNRSLPVGLGAWLQSVPPDRLPRGRILVRPCDARPALGELWAAARTPAVSAAGVLLEDVAVLAEQFARIADSDWVDIRLEVVRHDACWKFHRDKVPLRLLTTYLGPGTQIVAQGNVDAALEQQRAYAGTVAEIPRYAVALFKGADLAGEGSIVHRSPPIARTGRVRLVLCLNTASASSPEPSWPGNGDAKSEAVQAEP